MGFALDRLRMGVASENNGESNGACRAERDGNQRGCLDK